MGLCQPGCHLRNLGHLSGGTQQALEGRVWGSGEIVGAGILWRQTPAPGEPESQQRRGQTHGSGSEKPVSKLEEFPTLGVAIHLMPSFYSCGTLVCFQAGEGWGPDFLGISWEA